MYRFVHFLSIIEKPQYYSSNSSPLVLAQLILGQIYEQDTYQGSQFLNIDSQIMDQCSA